MKNMYVEKVRRKQKLKQRKNEIGIMLILILFCIMYGLFVCIPMYKTHKEERTQQEIKIAEQKNLQESLNAVKREKQKKVEKAKEEYKLILEQEQIVKQKEIVENIIKQDWPIGTYVRNNKTGEKGRLINDYQFTVCKTDFGWTFDIRDCKDIEMIGKEEYYEYCRQQNKILTIKEKQRQEEESKAAKPIQEEMIKQLFPFHPISCQIKVKAKDKGMYNGYNYYRIFSYDGLYLVTKDKKKIFYKDAIKVSDTREFDIATGNLKVGE